MTAVSTRWKSSLIGTLLAALALTMTVGVSPADAFWASDADYWTGHGSAYTYVGGYAGCGSGWKAWCNVYDVTNYTRDYGADDSRVAGNIDLAGGSASITLGWKSAGATWTSSGYQCNFEDPKFDNYYWARHDHSGTACRVESYWWTTMDDMSTTGSHWVGSWGKSRMAWTSI